MTYSGPGGRALCSSSCPTKGASRVEQHPAGSRARRSPRATARSATREEAFFDDHAWTIRYLVVDTGGWLSGRNVLISPYSVQQPLRPGQPIDVALSRQQVKDSPDIDTHQPVSRRAERQYNSYYAYPEYWVGDGLWPMGPIPLLPPPLPPDPNAPAAAVADDDVPPEDVHLRSSAAVDGHNIQATDESIGHVRDDFVFDDCVVGYPLSRRRYPQLVAGRQEGADRHPLDREHRVGREDGSRAPDAAADPGRPGVRPRRSPSTATTRRGCTPRSARQGYWD